MEVMYELDSIQNMQYVCLKTITFTVKQKYK